MSSSRQDSCRQQGPPDPAPGDPWVRESVRSAGEINQIIATVLSAMRTAGYPERDIFGVRLAFEEALVNAHKHGNAADAAKQVSIRYQVTAERVLVEVEDQGAGFNPNAVADPLALENLDKAGGRGLLLMRAYMTWVRYNERGNCVTLCKCRSTP